MFIFLQKENRIIFFFIVPFLVHDDFWPIINKIWEQQWLQNIIKCSLSVCFYFVFIRHEKFNEKSREINKKKYWIMH